MPGSPGQHWSHPIDPFCAAVGRITGKTLLSTAVIPALTLDLSSEALTETNQAFARLERELSTHGIAVIEDGPHFLRLVPTSASASTVAPPLRGAALAALTNQEVLPSGLVNFPATDVEQVLLIYAELAQRTILRPAVIPRSVIRLITTCPLNRAEVIYAFETVLALNGLKVVNDGAHFIQVIPLGTKASLKLAAPQPLKGAPLFDPGRVPQVTARPVIRPSTGWDVEKARRLFYELLHLRDPRSASADRLLRFYASLAEKTALPSPKLGGTFTLFTVTTPLTREELMYAIKTTLALNDLAIIPMEGRSVRLGRPSELDAAAKAPPKSP